MTMLATSDLSKVTQGYLLGFCKNDSKRAEAIARVVFQPESTSVRKAARRAGISPTHLYRLSKKFRDGMNDLITTRRFSVSDFVKG